jgi:hypothetical protein
VLKVSRVALIWGLHLWSQVSSYCFYRHATVEHPVDRLLREAPPGYPPVRVGVGAHRGRGGHCAPCGAQELRPVCWLYLYNIHEHRCIQQE